MHVMFTEQEDEWLVKEPFNWHVKEGTPENIRKSIEKKLELLNGKPQRGRRERRA